jgi:hypothetical protein
MANEEKKKFKDTVVGKLFQPKKKEEAPAADRSHLEMLLKKLVKLRALMENFLGMGRSTTRSTKKKLASRRLQYQSLVQKNLQNLIQLQKKVKQNQPLHQPWLPQQPV